MPRYKSSDYRPRKRNPSFRGQALFLHSLSDAQFKTVQGLAARSSSPDVHPGAFQDIASADRLSLIHALHAEHKAKQRGEPTGGSLGDGFSWLGDQLYNLFVTPFTSLWEEEKDALYTEFPELAAVEEAWDASANVAHMVTHDNSISRHTNLVAGMIAETYKADNDDKEDSLAGYTRDKTWDDNKFIDVWRSDEYGHTIVSVRGSKTPEDFLVDDYQILTEGHPRDLISEDLQEIVEKYGKDKLEIGGHSLGASLIAESLTTHPDLQSQFDRVDLYNPGSSPLAEESVVNKLIDKDNSYFYLNVADPVSWGTTFHGAIPHDNLIINTPQGLSPMANHSIDQWTEQDDSSFK
jgi:hypothetical protein